MTILQKPLKERCVIDSALAEFGQHNTGYLGCIWCKVKWECLQFHPTVGNSVLLRKDIRKSKETASRLLRTYVKGKYMALDKAQKQFIRKKVRELGSREKVKKLYRRKCAVDDYANRVAERMLK